MWGEKASRQHNPTFSRGGLTLAACLFACLLPCCNCKMMKELLFKSTPSLVFPEQPDWANNRRRCFSNSMATSLASYKTQTTAKVALHTHTHIHTHEPDNPFIGLDPWTLGSSFTCYNSIHTIKAVSPAPNCSAYTLLIFPRSKLRLTALETVTLSTHQLYYRTLWRSTLFLCLAVWLFGASWPPCLQASLLLWYLENHVFVVIKWCYHVVLPLPIILCSPFFDFFQLKLCCWFSFPQHIKGKPMTSPRLPFLFLILYHLLLAANSFPSPHWLVWQTETVMRLTWGFSIVELFIVRNGVERVPALRHIIWLLVVEGCNTGFCSDHVREGVQKTVTDSSPPHSIWTPSLLYANGQDTFTNADKLHPLPTSPSLMVPPKTRHPPS